MVTSGTFAVINSLAVVVTPSYVVWRVGSLETKCRAPIASIVQPATFVDLLNKKQQQKCNNIFWQISSRHSICFAIASAVFGPFLALYQAERVKLTCSRVQWLIKSFGCCLGQLKSFIFQIFRAVSELWNFGLIDPPTSKLWNFDLWTGPFLLHAVLSFRFLASSPSVAAYMISLLVLTIVLKHIWSLKWR